MKRFCFVSTLLLAVAAAPLSAQQVAQPQQDAPQADWRESYAYAIGMQAVVYGYPIMLNVRQRYFQVEKPMGAIDTPVNAWFHSPRVPNSDDKYGISPSDNLYYSLAWFDVSSEPLVITVPDAGTRYYSIQMMEMYTDIFGYVGKRETANKAGNYLLVGPHWKGKIPKGITAIRRSPTPKGALLMRILIDSRDNLEAPMALASKTKIAPLSNWQSGKAFTAGNRDVVDFLPAQSGDPFWFFKNVNRGMTENPPPASDEALLRSFREIGIGAGIGENFEALDPATQRGLKRAQSDGIAMIAKAAVGAANTKVVNHWAYGTANWGRTARDKDFLTRASTQGHAGWQEHWIEEVVKLRAHHDGDGQLLNGANRYEIRFSPEAIPQVGAFWSVTLYDDKYNLSANSIGRYSLGSPELGKMKRESDGSVIIYVQTDPPAQDRMTNWLPSPRGPFNLFLRAYLPGEALMRQDYTPPPVRRMP